MTSKTDSSLRKLSRLSQSLNKISDDLSKALNAIEEAINSLNLGVSAWVRLNSEVCHDHNGSGYNSVTTIGYDRTRGKWGLLYASYLEETGPDPDDPPEFLRDAPRKVRIEAIEKLPELLEKLFESASAMTREAEISISKAQEIVTALSEGRS